MLSRLAREFAAEISSHDWSDSPYRRDRAGHQRFWDSRPSSRVLDADETDAVRMNVMWVTAQVLRNLDPNLNVHEFAEACGVQRSRIFKTDGKPNGVISNGLRWRDSPRGEVLSPLGAPLYRVVVQCEAPNVVVFKRLLQQVGAMNPGLPPTTIEDAYVHSSVGTLRTVTVFVRDWRAANDAADTALALVSRATESLTGGGPPHLVKVTPEVTPEE